MDAIIGRYKARLEESGLILKHEAGISFELTPIEALGFWNFINAYRETLVAMQRETDPRIERVVMDEHDDQYESYCIKYAQEAL